MIEGATILFLKNASYTKSAPMMVKDTTMRGMDGLVIRFSKQIVKIE